MDANAVDNGGHAAHHEHAHHESHARAKNGWTDRDWKSIAVYAIAVIAILAMAVFIRSRMLGMFGFFEPDGYYHFSVIRAAINNGFVIPKILSISGWPVHGAVTEPHGLYWITLIPYFFLRFLGVSYYTIMRIMPVLFGLLNVIGAYYLSRYISKDKLFGLLVMVLVALSLGDSARTSATVYRGDSFVTIFLILSLILAINTIMQADRRKKLYLAIATGFVLSLCNIVWNGAAFAFATMLFGFMLLASIAFILGKSDLLKGSGYLLVTFIAWYLLVNAYTWALGWITSVEVFSGIDSILLLALVGLGWLMAYYVDTNRHRMPAFLGSAAGRTVLLAAVAVFGFVIIEAVASSIVYSIFIGNGFIPTTNFGATIEELQAPSASYFYQSFGVVLATTPMTALMYLSSYAHNAKVLIWIFIMLSMILYLFMRIDDDGNGFLSGSPSIKFSVSAAFVLIMAYLGLTSYLQIHAIRFNSLVAVPIALFSAYTVYWLIAYAKKLRRILYYASAVPLFIILAMLSWQAIAYTSHLYPADAINGDFIRALQWMSLNTPPSSVVLTIWPDGSVVEGIANRTSVTDSVGAQRNMTAGPFATWILNQTSDGQFLLGSSAGRPDYLLARSTWLLETSGIFTESGLNRSLAQSYGYSVLNQFAEGANATDQIIRSSDGQSLTTIVDFKNRTDGTKSVTSALYYNGQEVPASYFVLYDQDTLNYSIYNLDEIRGTPGNGDMILLLYSNVPRHGYFLNVTGTIVFGSAIAQSNMLSFIYLCNYHECRWDNSVASLQLVYHNEDTNIFKIDYNSTAR
ncbi:MAG: hypothetical protein KGH69_03255 [Candidatus Micrarchaeota archaeon]|nr:hypothetical protein [Candidatus Micrarchaeota archaeon]